jgi:Outer membrane receptor for ferrienterochelin and colicins
MILKKNRVLARMFTTVSLAAIGLSSSPALAQAAPDEAPESRGLQEIVVTARKVAENLQDVPVAVTALSGDDLIDRNVQRVQDVANFTPGFSIRQGSNTPSALILTLRGQVQSDTLITLDPSVGTYVDGVYWARSYGLNGDFLDVESAQILKGRRGPCSGATPRAARS